MSKTLEQIHLENCTEIGLNKGVAYRRVTATWYPLCRKGAVYGWELYETTNRLYVHFSTREAAVDYLKGR
jgi:hypothetical protein